MSPVTRSGYRALLRPAESVSARPEVPRAGRGAARRSRTREIPEVPERGRSPGPRDPGPLPAMTKAVLCLALLSLSGCAVVLPAFQGAAAVMTVIVDAPKVGPAARELLHK